MYTKETILKARYASFRKRMEAEGINLAIIARPTDFFHFCLYTPNIFSMLSYIIIPLEGEPTVLVSAIRGPKALEEVAYGQVRCYGKWSDNPSISPDLYEAIRIVVSEYGIKDLRVGCELEFLPTSDYGMIISKLKIPAMKDISQAVLNERMIKDELALDRMRMSADLVNVGMETIIASLRAGSTERTACTRALERVNVLAEERYPDLEYAGFGTAEESIKYSMSFSCLSGVRSAYGSAQPSASAPAEGEFALPVSVVRLGGYGVESERTLYVKQISAEKERIFKTMLESRQRAFELIKPGNTFADLYHAAAGVFVKNGYEEFLPGRIGHGIGLGNHEKPSVDGGSTMPLQPGMVFTVEPGMMSVKFGGARHSDTVIVTETGYELLTTTDNGFLNI